MAIIIILVTLVAGLGDVVGNYILVDIPDSWRPLLLPLFILMLIATGWVAVWQGVLLWSIGE